MKKRLSIGNIMVVKVVCCKFWAICLFFLVTGKLRLYWSVFENNIMSYSWSDVILTSLFVGLNKIFFLVKDTPILSELQPFKNAIFGTTGAPLTTRELIKLLSLSLFFWSTGFLKRQVVCTVYSWKRTPVRPYFVRKKGTDKLTGHIRKGITHWL